MTNKEHKEIIIQVRLTKNQESLLNESYKNYTSTNKEIITKSEYIRRQLMLGCLRTLGILKLGPNEKETPNE